MKDQYEDIINLPHHVSDKHPRMSMEDRAAQFAPFAALTGHAEAIRDTARSVAESFEKDEDSEQEASLQKAFLQEASFQKASLQKNSIEETSLQETALEEAFSQELDQA